MPVIFDLEFVVRVLCDVRFDQRGAVAIDDALMDAQLIARRADDALDEIITRLDRRRENDDVAAVGARKPVFELVDEQDVVNLQRRFHRAAGNVKGPHHEGDEEQRDEARDDEGVEVFADDRARRRRRRHVAGRHP